MDAEIPDEHEQAARACWADQARALLQGGRTAVLTLATGGCARYAFSSEVSYVPDRRGFPLILYRSENPHHHLILSNTTMELRLVHEVDGEGNELTLVIATGMLRRVDPGDHDSLDRYHAAFHEWPDTGRRGRDRLYRFEPDHIRLEFFSGQRIALDKERVLEPIPR